MKKILFFAFMGLFLTTQVYAQSAEVASYPGSLRNISRQVISKLKRASIGRCTIKNFVNNDGETDDVSFFLKNEIMNKLIDMGGNIHFIDSSRRSLMGASAQNKKDSQALLKDKAELASRNHIPHKSCFMRGRYLRVGNKIKLYIQLRSYHQNNVIMNKSFNIPIRGELAIIINGDIIPPDPEPGPDPNPYPIDERYIRLIVRDEIYKILGEYNYFGSKPKKEKALKKYDYGDLSFSISKAIKNGESIFMEVLFKNTGSTSKNYEVNNVQLYYTSFFSLNMDKELSSFDNRDIHRRFNISLSPGETKSGMFHFDDTFDKVRDIYALKFNISTRKANGLSGSRREISLKNIPISNGG